MRVRIFALDVHIDPGNAVAIALFDVVDEIELPRIFEESRVGLDVGERVTDAAVLILERAEVGGHLRLVEVVAALELQLGQQLLARILGIADD